MGKESGQIGFLTRLKVKDDGSIQIYGLPFKPGEQVEVVIKSIVEKPTKAEHSTPRDKSEGVYYYYYEHPFDPAVPLEDWECLK